MSPEAGVLPKTPFKGTHSKGQTKYTHFLLPHVMIADGVTLTPGSTL